MRCPRQSLSKGRWQRKQIRRALIVAIAVSRAPWRPQIVQNDGHAGREPDQRRAVSDEKLDKQALKEAARCSARGFDGDQHRNLLRRRDSERSWIHA